MRTKFQRLVLLLSSQGRGGRAAVRMVRTAQPTILKRETRIQIAARWARPGGMTVRRARLHGGGNHSRVNEWLCGGGAGGRREGWRGRASINGIRNIFDTSSTRPRLGVIIRSQWSSGDTRDTIGTRPGAREMLAPSP
ncbi:hypothetical protein C8R45DRAFT_1023479 [Mycena sanguinolenta]|nr:hypothetical protein C8R45DRAFT_1023479 [Mycena sanguinolenta]